MFDPKAHLIQLPRRVRDPITGHFTTRHDEYLEVKWRLVWFREKYPQGSIITEEMAVDLDQGYARFKASVGDGEGGMATGTGTETRKSFEDFVEKAETRAIGRALAALGIGTQFVGEELSEGEHVADAPVPTPATTAPDPLPLGEGVSHSAAEKHPTADEVTTLTETARAANVDLEAFGHDIRRLMKLPESQKITKKFLRETMTMSPQRRIALYPPMRHQPHRGLHRVRQTALSHHRLHQGQTTSTPTPHVRSYGARRLPGASPRRKLPISSGTMR